MPSELLTRASIFLQGARQRGLAKTVLLRLFSEGATLLLWILLLPATLLLHAMGYRRLTVITGRIGHLAAEVDCFLKARALGELPERRWFLLAPSGRVANPHLLEYWKSHLQVVTNPLLCSALQAMSRWLLLRYDVSHYVLRLGATQEIYRLNALWGGRPPCLKLTPADTEWAEQALCGLGIPKGTWFACVHVREPGFSPADEAAHAHRNGDPRAILPAVAEIVRRGGLCVRMGDPSMSPLPGVSGLIDYAHHPMRSARLDVVLCAKARFFLGNSSGLALVSSVFGVPSALVNMIPLSALAVLPVDLSIPKLLRNRATGSFMTFPDIFASPASDFRYATLFAKAGLDPVENDAEDILALTVEMLDRIEGTFSGQAGDEERQRSFMALLRPGHYSYGTAARVGAAFLRRHATLLAAN